MVERIKMSGPIAKTKSKKSQKDKFLLKRYERELKWTFVQQQCLDVEEQSNIKIEIRIMIKMDMEMEWESIQV